MTADHREQKGQPKDAQPTTQSTRRRIVKHGINFTGRELAILNFLKEGREPQEIALVLGVKKERLSGLVNRARRKYERAEMVQALTELVPPDFNLNVSPARRRRVKQSPERPLYTPIQKVIINLRAQGLLINEIAKKMKMSDPAVNGQLYRLRRELGTQNSVETVLTCMRLGVIDFSKVLDGFDVNKFDKLTQSEREIVEALISKDGAQSTAVQLSKALGIPEGEMSKQLTKMFEKYNVKDKLSLASLYAAYLYTKQEKITPKE